MEEAKFGYQVWHENEMVHTGFGNAATLDKFAEMVMADIEANDDDYDLDELGWTVWNLETKHYLEYQGSKLVDQG